MEPAKLVVLALVLLVAGCFAPGGNEKPGSGKFVLQYVSPDGLSINWTWDGIQTNLLDAAGNRQTARAIGLEIQSPGLTDGPLTAFVFVSEQGDDLAVVFGCTHQRNWNCTESKVEWRSSIQALAFHGALLLPRFVRENGTLGHVLLDGIERQFVIREETPNSVTLHPIRFQPRSAVMCNILDDNTTVDLARNIITRCESRLAGATIRLSGESDPLPFSRGGANPVYKGRISPPVKNDGPLPSGAAYLPQGRLVSFLKAHLEALNKSTAFAGFAASHPEMTIETAKRTGSGETPVPGGLIEERFEEATLRYVASNAGYEIRIRETIRTANGVTVSDEYSVVNEGPWTPPESHQWADMAPPPMQANLSVVAVKVENLFPTSRVFEVYIEDMAQAGAAGPRHAYYFLLTKKECRDSPERQCLPGHMVAFDASAGLLAGGSFGSAGVGILFAD